MKYTNTGMPRAAGAEEPHETGRLDSLVYVPVSDVWAPPESCLPPSVLFLDSLFPPAPTVALRAPTPRPSRGCNRSALVEPSRRSLRQVTNKSVVPVSQRATTRLIRQLDLVRKGENITKSTMKEYAALFKGPKTNPPPPPLPSNDPYKAT
jgi:hypothetical protein